MRHTHTIQFYNSIDDCSKARDTVPRFQCFTELPEAYPIHHTRLMSLHMNEIIFACRPPVVPQTTNLWRTAQNMYPVVAVSLKFHILGHIYLCAHFGDVASSC